MDYLESPDFAAHVAAEWRKSIQEIHSKIPPELLDAPPVRALPWPVCPSPLSDLNREVQIWRADQKVDQPPDLEKLQSIMNQAEQLVRTLEILGTKLSVSVRDGLPPPVATSPEPQQGNLTTPKEPRERSFATARDRGRPQKEFTRQRADFAKPYYDKGLIGGWDCVKADYAVAYPGDPDGSKGDFLRLAYKSVYESTRSRTKRRKSK